MIKIKGKRYNLDAMQSYEDHITPDGASIIIIEWRNSDPTTSIKFDTVQERDKTLKAMDEVSLLVNEGEVVVREMPIEMPFALGGDGFDPSGGINLQ